MRICFLLHEVGRSGGVGVVLAHARRLAEREGWHVELVVTGSEPGDGDAAGLPVVALRDARGPYDVAIATWWETAPALFAVQARRRALFVQSLEERFYRASEPFARLAAGLVLALPVDFLVVAPWMRDVLHELRPEARCFVVANGIDKEAFRPRPGVAQGGPLRVLVEGQPTLWFKGVDAAIAAVRAMAEPVQLTLVAADPEQAGELDVDRLTGRLDAGGMAALYAESDVLLKLSRIEGMPLPPVEALHVGLPCVVTPHTGHEEYVVHGENGIVVGFDDRPGTSSWLDHLARDRDLLATLGEGARARAAAWPSADEAASELAQALERIEAEPAPDMADAAAADMLRRVRAAADFGREYVGRMQWVERGLEEARELNRVLFESRDECAELLEQVRDERDEARARLAEIRSSLPYRTARGARNIVRRVRP